MPDDKADKPEGFRVTDRRASVDDTETAVAHAEADKADAATRDAEQAFQRATANHGGDMPPIDFLTFVLSLGTSALMHLGEQLDPEHPASPPNLPLARQTIDVLGLIDEKTKGNLTGQEETLLSQLLFDLRMRYVAADKAGK